jgi:LPXTG-motif cell wall-anchored protein
MNRRVGVAVSTTLVASAFSLAAALPAFATPKGDPQPPVSGDSRATAHDGNATTCKQAGLPGEKITVKFVTDKDNRHVTITSVPSGVELTGTVVKGGSAYNVYSGQHLTDLHAPLVGKDNKNIPQISHWFACGIKKSPTSSSTTTTTTTTSTSTTTSSSSSNGGGSSSTTTTAPAAQGRGGATGAGGELANTGFSATGALVAGGALLLIGGGLMFLVRRSRTQRR